MTATIRIAAVQLHAHDREDFARSLDAIAATARRAAENADLVVLPEATFPAYVLGDARIDDSAIEGALDRLREIARTSRTVIVAGAALHDGIALRNAAIVIDADGTTAGRADKIFLWHFDRSWFEAGQRIEPVMTTLGKLGVLVCADGRIPTIARALVDRGAALLVMPTAWVTSGRNPDALENVQADLLARVRARENGVPLVAANKCGSERMMVAYCGKSQIVDAHGNLLAIAGQHDAEIVAASVTIGTTRPFRSTLDTAVAPVRRAVSPRRIAICDDPFPADLAERMAVLGADCAMSPDGQWHASSSDPFPCARVDETTALDPAGIVGYQRAGYGCVAWSAVTDDDWIEPFARARALELRMYAVVFDTHARRTFAVDPDGTVIAGTFDDYRLATFTFDPRETLETTVAPGTDVAEGIESTAAILENFLVT